MSERCDRGCGRHATLFYTHGTRYLALCNVHGKQHADALDAAGWKVIVPG